MRVGDEKALSMWEYREVTDRKLEVGEKKGFSRSEEEEEEEEKEELAPRNGLLAGK